MWRFEKTWKFFTIKIWILILFVRSLIRQNQGILINERVENAKIKLYTQVCGILNEQNNSWSCSNDIKRSGFWITKRINQLNFFRSF